MRVLKRKITCHFKQTKNYYQVEENENTRKYKKTNNDLYREKKL